MNRLDQRHPGASGAGLRRRPRDDRFRPRQAGDGRAARRGGPDHARGGGAAGERERQAERSYRIAVGDRPACRPWRRCSRSRRCCCCCVAICASGRRRRPSSPTSAELLKITLRQHRRRRHHDRYRRPGDEHECGRRGDHRLAARRGRGAAAARRCFGSSTRRRGRRPPTRSRGRWREGMVVGLANHTRADRPARRRAIRSTTAPRRSAAATAGSTAACLVFRDITERQARRGRRCAAPRRGCAMR